MVYLGIASGDAHGDLDYLRDKIVGLRVFADAEGRMNLSVGEVGGGVLVVSQFTLYGDARRGRRPSYNAAATPDVAEQWYQEMVSALRGVGLGVATGKFQSHMEVAAVNDGPVTILLDSQRLF